MTTKPDDNLIDDNHQNASHKNTASSSSHSLAQDQERPAQYRFARAYSQREDTLNDNYYARTTTHASLWLELQRWFLVNTFAPQWLPKRWQHPIIGYLIALVLQVIAALATILMVHIFPTFIFSGLLEILSVAIIALNFGTGPSLLATLVGITLLNFFVFPPRSSLSLNEIQGFVESILFLLVGITISIVASQVERARRSAIAERTLLDAVIETVPDSVSIYDAQGRLVRLNGAGRHLEEERGIRYPAFTAATGKLRTPTGSFFPQAELPVRRALQGETISAVEMVWQPIAGNKQYFIVSAAPMYDALERIGGVVSISHDVSALRRSELAAAASASELEAIFESITDGVFVFNQEGRVTRMNTAFRELLGIHIRTDYFSHSPDERRTLFTMSDEQGHPLPFEQWPQSRILRGETLKGSMAVDILVQTVDGREILMSASGAPVYMQDKKLIGGVVICRDITERRRLETYTQNALHALLDMAQTLIQGKSSQETREHGQTHSVGQRLVELTSRVLNCKRIGIISVTSETERLLPVAIVGLTPEQEQQWWSHMPTLHLADMADAFSITRLRAGEVVSLDAAHRIADEEYKQHGPKNFLLVPMNIGAELVGLLSLDYTNEEYVYTDDEKALVGAVAKLVALVIERERLLREHSEARANEIALRESNERMNEFLGIASHELKTPITTIKGSAQLLERRLKKMIALETVTVEERTHIQEEAQDLLRRTNVQVNRLTRLINDLLDMSRIQAHKLEPHMEYTDLMTVIRDVVQEQSRGAATRTILLHLPSENTVPVFIDVDRIEQVVTNYISNALKYSATDKPIAVSSHVQHSEVVVSVHDEGPGIPAEEWKHVFERFYRVKGIEVKSGSGVGLGLGLYICKTIIELHQGQVGVESEEGKGSTFWFSLPLANEYHKDLEN
ncbi:MAG: hypothetical protein NVS4B12_13330 [Ktedonobacteraceae bacterium]